jgi:hypothetical protein
MSKTAPRTRLQYVMAYSGQLLHLPVARYSQVSSDERLKKPILGDCLRLRYGPAG